MFHRIDRVGLHCRDSTPLIELYQQLFGFRNVATQLLDENSNYRKLWGLPSGPLTVHLLDKAGAGGGGLRIVSGPAIPDDGRLASLGTPGPFALDFYVRGLDGLVKDMRELGYRFRSEIVSYKLFGTEFEVREILLEAPLGLVHALVEFLPDRHRCILGRDESQRVSEVVAAVTAVDDIEQGLVTLRDALSGQIYFDQVFSGDSIERLVGLDDGTSFRAVLLRGPRRENARIELMSTTCSRPAGQVATHVDPMDSFAHVLLSIPVQDIDETLEGVRGFGVVTGPCDLEENLGLGARAFLLRTFWGANLEFFQA